MALSLWFWVAVQQTGGTLTLFARDHTDRLLNLALPAGPKVWEVPVGWMASIHAGLVILLSPVVGVFWGWRQRTGRAVSGEVQLAVGMAFLAAAYGCLALPLCFASTARVGFGWLLFCYTGLSLAEICVGPLGYSLVSRCAPAGYSGLLLGAWLSVTAIGSFLAGELGAQVWTRWSPPLFCGWMAGGSVLVCAVLVGTEKFRRAIPFRTGASA
jgi:POT family proton-dependent oligopeptide transporter